MVAESIVKPSKTHRMKEPEEGFDMAILPPGETGPPRVENSELPGFWVFAPGGNCTLGRRKQLPKRKTRTRRIKGRRLDVYLASCRVPKWKSRFTRTRGGPLCGKGLHSWLHCWPG